MAEPEQPQIYLITPPEIELSRFPDTLARVLDAHDVACIRLALSTHDETALSHAADGTPTSFLHVLNATATTDDFVVVKVDIDNGPELQVVHAIAKVPELGALVDELFFEAHFYFDGIQFGWGALGADRRHTVDEALALMRTLRERGIRSHFWI